MTVGAPKLDFAGWPREQKLALVVDANAYERHLTGQFLEILGFTPQLAGDGRTAAKIFRAAADDFAFVVVNAELPGVSGAETIDMLRGIRGDLPIVYLTNDLKHGNRLSRNDEAFDCLTTPISFGQLEFAVRKAARLRRSPSFPPPLSP